MRKLRKVQLNYMRGEFAFHHIQGVRDGDPMQFHAYELRQEATSYVLKLKERISTDTAGIAMCLGLQADTKVELQTMLDQIEAKLPQSQLLTVGGGPIPVPETTGIEAADES
jgi:hypothetical protein